MSHALSVTAAAEARRSIRKYEPEPIAEADLREILRVAGLAPSAWNIQPWRVAVVREPSLKSALQAAAYGQPQVGSAPAVFVVYSDMADALEKLEDTVHPGMSADATSKHLESVRGIFGGFPPEGRESWASGQANIFLGFLLLSIKAHGYDSSPMLGFQPPEVKALLGLPAHASIQALVAVGKGTEPGFPHHRHTQERFVSWR